MSFERLDWALCRSFLAILREGSLSAAARRLQLTHPTIRRHLDELEQILGAALFVRSPTGLMATPLAIELREPAEAMESSAHAMVRAASAEKGAMSGTVRLTASEVVGVEVLPPILAGIRAAHPGLVFELVISNTVQDILRRDADIAIRMTRPRQPDLIARKIATVRLGLYAHRRWIDAHGMPESLSALVQARHLIGYDRDGQALIDAFAARGAVLSPADFGFRSDSGLAQLAAIRAGLGVGVCQARIAGRDPTLVPLLPDEGLALEMWLAMLPGNRAVGRIRAVADLIAIALKDYAG